jgi:hypothetical protein
LASDRPASREALIHYAVERKERMRRLRFAARSMTDIRCTFTPEGAARRLRWFRSLLGDDIIRGGAMAPIAGPESAPSESFTEAAYQKTLAL